MASGEAALRHYEICSKSSMGSGQVKHTRKRSVHLTDDERAKIKQRLDAGGVTGTQLAVEYGVTDGTISCIRTGRFERRRAEIAAKAASVRMRILPENHLDAGKQRCERLQCTLSTAACAARWRARSELIACNGCDIGKQNAGGQ